MNRPHKQSMSELKLRRLMEHNARLRDDLARPRIRVSEASARYVAVVCSLLRVLTALSAQLDSLLQTDEGSSGAFRDDMSVRPSRHV